MIFFASSISFEEKDIEKFLKILNVMFYLNVILAFYQYYVLGLYGDNIGGTFLLEGRGNGGLLLMLLFETTYKISLFLEKKISLKDLAIVIILSMLTSVLAELKAYFILFVVLTLIALIINKKSWKTIFAFIMAVAGIIIGISILNQIDPESAKILSTKEIFNYAGGESHGYSTKKDISRLRAFSQINKAFFNKSIFNKMFGLGLGSCDVSSLNIFNSNFYNLYGEKLHYTWFTHAMLYLETGVIGYGIFILFFVFIIYYCKKLRKKDKSNSYIYNSTILFAIACIVTTWYNSSLRNDTSFFAYIALVLPFIKYNNESKENIENNIFKNNK